MTEIEYLQPSWRGRRRILMSSLKDTLTFLVLGVAIPYVILFLLPPPSYLSQLVIRSCGCLGGECATDLKHLLMAGSIPSAAFFYMGILAIYESLQSLRSGQWPNPGKDVFFRTRLYFGKTAKAYSYLSMMGGVASLFIPLLVMHYFSEIIF